MTLRHLGQPGVWLFINNLWISRIDLKWIIFNLTQCFVSSEGCAKCKIRLVCLRNANVRTIHARMARHASGIAGRSEYPQIPDQAGGAAPDLPRFLKGAIAPFTLFRLFCRLDVLVQAEHVRAVQVLRVVAAFDFGQPTGRRRPTGTSARFARIRLGPGSWRSRPGGGQRPAEQICRPGQVARTGRRTRGSSLSGAMVADVIYRERRTAHSSLCPISEAPISLVTAASLGNIPAISRRIRIPLQPTVRSGGDDPTSYPRDFPCHPDAIQAA